MSASPKRPPSDLEQSQPEASTSSAIAPPSSSLLAFLGGQPRSNPSALNPEPAKRRRKNPDSTTQAQTQGRIVLNAAGGAAWTVEKRPEELNGVQSAGPGNGKAANGKGKGRGKVKGGEEDEMKEMGKRAKAAQRAPGSARNPGEKRKATKKEVGLLDLKAQDADGESPLDQFPKCRSCCRRR